MVFFYNGYVYCATLIYDDPYYGSRRKWRITFDSEVEISDAEKIIVENMNDDKKPSKKEYDKRVDSGKSSFYDYLKGYYDISYDEKENYFIYEEVEGYDD